MTRHVESLLMNGRERAFSDYVTRANPPLTRAGIRSAFEAGYAASLRRIRTVPAKGWREGDMVTATTDGPDSPPRTYVRGAETWTTRGSAVDFPDHVIYDVVNAGALYVYLAPRRDKGGGE